MSYQACLGEWQGRGKMIKISRSDSDELLVDMGPGVPPLVLVSTISDQSWPMKWAVVRRCEAGRSPGAHGTVYIFELPSPTSQRLLVKKPSGDGVVEFERVVRDAEVPQRMPWQRQTEECQDKSNTRELLNDEATSPAKAERSRSPHRSHSPHATPPSFADSLAKIVSDRKVVHTDRERVSAHWLEYEAKLLDEAVELFKQRCIREAENQRCGATISFEVLSREIDDFPKRQLSGSTYYVGTWGKGISAESWFYATRGVTATFSSGVQVLFAEVLQGMLPKFVDRVKLLGFQTCSHEAGTWKISVSWQRPEQL